MSLWQVIILAIVEGLTEFLPVSSTGHMIIASSLMGISHLELTKLITVNIQFGAILSVLVLYWRKFIQSFDFYLKLLAAFIPTAILGLLLNDFIDSLLENVLVVGISLFLGGIILIFIDSFFERKNMSRVITFPKAFTIGLFQCISMIPGVSRSAATIIGGMSQGLRRKDAAEFSFFLAVPTMFAATAYKLLKTYKNIHSHEISLLLVGNIIAFGVAMLAIKFFIGFLTRNGFKIFGYYRIVLGTLIIVLYALGFKLEIV